MHILEVQGLTKRFFVHHLQREIPAFAGVDVRLRRGEFLLVRGANGVGKSTLLRCLYRSYLPSAGQAIYHSAHG
ncbi:MAG: ATP-binding cassette domain-containing protein, partial [Oscillochloris sp.]|nr:ATP-binding cassette domain-containing protein [Oscillochloris sp.]